MDVVASLFSGPAADLLVVGRTHAVALKRASSVDALLVIRRVLLSLPTFLVVFALRLRRVVFGTFAALLVGHAALANMEEAVERFGSVAGSAWTRPAYVARISAMKSILVPVEDHDAMNEVLATAHLVAVPFQSYIEGIPLGPDIAEMVAADFSMSGVIFDDRTRRAFLRHAAETFETFMATKKIARRGDNGEGVSCGWCGDTLVSSSSIGEYGRAFDLIVVGRPGDASSEPNRSTLEAALFESGRPLIIAPPRAPPTIGTVIAIVWNGSSETARSIAFAMPLLARARDVPVLAVPDLHLPGPSDAEMTRSLRRHGIPARVVEMRDGRRSPGRALLAAASDLGADLMIKGGYTQSRIRQLIFGSVTSDILAEATLPIFMAH